MRLNGIGLLFLAGGVGWVVWALLRADLVETSPPPRDEEVARIYEFPMSHVARAPQFYDQDASA